MKPDLVPDCDVMKTIFSLPYFWAASREWYRWYFSWVLGRELTQAEADEILSKAHYGPQPFERTYAALTRNGGPFFWRSHV